MKKYQITSLILLVLLIISIFIRVPNYVYTEKHGDEIITTFNDYNYLPIVKASLNGQEAYFVLDSGASISVLDTDYANEYNFTIGGSYESNVVGYGGQTNSLKDISNYTIKLGKIKLHNFIGKDLTYISNTIEEATGIDVVGIIGNNNISEENLIIDFRKNIIRK